MSGEQTIARAAKATVLFLSLLGCSDQSRVDVHVQPAGYTVGTVVSKSATDAVNEVVRLRPEAVLIRTCTRTPPALVNQFQIELLARTKVELKLSVTEECRR